MATKSRIPKPPPPVAPGSMLQYGAIGSMALGVVHLASWGYARAIDTGPWVLSIFGFLGGALLIALGLLARKRSRAAWAFLLAFNAVVGLASMFGAPSIHRGFEIPLAAAFVPFAAHSALAVLLALAGGELEGRKPAPTATHKKRP